MLKSKPIMKRIFPLLLALQLLLACARQTSTPESLDQAPGFELVATDGRTVALADYTGQQPVLLFFHMAVG
jgi:hypothetical protein